MFYQVSNGGDHPDSDVEDVKKFGAVIPVFLSSVGFFAVYAQVSPNTIWPPNEKSFCPVILNS